MVNKKVNIANSINIYFFSFLISASLITIKSCKAIVKIMYCWICSIYKYNMDNNIARKGGEGGTTLVAQ